MLPITGQQSLISMQNLIICNISSSWGIYTVCNKALSKAWRIKVCFPQSVLFMLTLWTKCDMAMHKTSIFQLYVHWVLDPQFKLFMVWMKIFHWKSFAITDQTVKTASFSPWKKLYTVCPLPFWYIITSWISYWLFSIFLLPFSL